ncbi:MAG: 50S ribosomal protein L6 [archaeon]
MKKEIIQEIEIPKGVEVNLEGNLLTVKGDEGENKKELNIGGLDFEKKGDKLIIGNKKATKNEKKMINTISAHIRNLIKGVQEKFEYKLKICFNHFPITIDIKGNEAIIKNFLGEKVPRKVKIIKETEVKIDGPFITIISTNKELAGQTAANFEEATKIKMKDRRVFQDGIFMISKAGREI